MAKKFPPGFALIALAFIFSAFLKAVPKTPPGILLSPADQIETNPFFLKILASEAGISRERAKIAYLISRIRQSPYSFMRNGKSFNGSRAATHLTLKYQRRFDLIKEAVDFIEKVAGRSSRTGEDYGIQFPDGKIYPAAEVLLNELNVLEKRLQTSARASEAGTLPQ